MVTAFKKEQVFICLYFSNSIFIEENEEIIQYLINNLKIKIVPLNIPLGYPGFTRLKRKRFDKSLTLCRRFYPHSHNLQSN